jgi:hypothetical protein
LILGLRLNRPVCARDKFIERARCSVRVFSGAVCKRSLFCSASMLFCLQYPACVSI